MLETNIVYDNTSNRSAIIAAILKTNLMFNGYRVTTIPVHELKDKQVGFSCLVECESKKEILSLVDVCVTEPEYDIHELVNTIDRGEYHNLNDIINLFKLGGLAKESLLLNNMFLPEFTKISEEEQKAYLDKMAVVKNDITGNIKKKTLKITNTNILVNLVEANKNDWDYYDRVLCVSKTPSVLFDSNPVVKSFRLVSKLDILDEIDEQMGALGYWRYNRQIF